MKRESEKAIVMGIVLVLATSVFIVFGCASTQPPGFDTSGPYYHQFYSATSSDGINSNEAVFGPNDYKTFFKTIVGEESPEPQEPQEETTVHFTNSTYKSVSPTEQGDWLKEASIRVPEGVSSCTLMLPNGTYRMYYTGMDGILSAFSFDGLTWTVEDGVRISLGALGSEQERVCNCAVIEIPGGYRMIYEGVQGEPPNDVHRFFSATSTDGLNWTKEDGVRLESVGTSDYGQVSSPDIIILPDGSLRMYYVGDFYHKGAEGNSIRSAISYDFGLTWTREGSRALGENTMDPDIVKIGNEYRMFYTTLPLGQKSGNLTICSAFSSNGLNWMEELGVRVAPSGPSDMKNCRHPDVVRLPDGAYRMYYTGMNSNNGTNILSALRLPFSAENSFALDFSESRFKFIYPMDRRYFTFKGTNNGTKNILARIDQAECIPPLGYVHVTTPQGTNYLAPGESIWFRLVLGEPYGAPGSTEGTYNFTVSMRFNIYLPDVIPPIDDTYIFMNKSLQIEYINRNYLPGDVVIQGRVVDKKGFPISDCPIDIETPGGGLAGTRTDGKGYFSYSIAESEAYFLIIQKPGYRAVTLEIDGDNVQDFYNITLTKETEDMSIRSTLINSVKGNIGFWRCAATADESRLLLVNGMENWVDESLKKQSKLYLLDTNTGEVIWTHKMGWESWTADITDDGKYVVFGSLLQWPRAGPKGFVNFIRLLNGTDGSIIWQKNITSEEFPEYWEDGQSYTRGVKFSHNGEYIIVAVEFDYVYLLKRSDGSIKWRKWVSQNVREFLFTHDDQYVYISAGNGQLYKVRVEDGSEVWKQWTGAWAVVNGLHLSSDEQLIAVGTKGGWLSVINTTDGSIKFSGYGSINCFSPDGTMIAIDGDPALTVLDLNGTLLWKYHRCGPCDIHFSGDGKLMFVATGQIFNAYGTLLHEIGVNQERISHVGWINSDATRFIWAVRDTPTTENVIEVYRIEWSANTPPVASFTYSPEKPFVNETIIFNAFSSYDPDGNITSYEWNFGDGNVTSTTHEVLNHSYSEAGSYEVTLTVTDDDGVTNSTTKIITVYQPTTIFDTGTPSNPYPSISGTHYGTITPTQTIIATKLYTYPCLGTGGHTGYARIGNKTWNATATWKGYIGDWHNITFDKTVVLLPNKTYNYTIRTGSYPQIHHNTSLLTPNGWINCSEFVDANGKVYYDWIPAIRLS